LNDPSAGSSSYTYYGAGEVKTPKTHWTLQPIITMQMDGWINIQMAQGHTATHTDPTKGSLSLARPAGYRAATPIIDTTSIKFKGYYNTDNLSKESYVRLGTILNDTTFIITKLVRSDGKHESEKNETYHFRLFSPKPDSTNNLIK
jgi:hypothetical protein